MANLYQAIRWRYRVYRKFSTVALVLVIFSLFLWLAKSHVSGESWGIWSLLPTLLVLFVAIITRRPFESMITGGVAGLIMLDPSNLITPFASQISAIFGNATIVWVILVCGLMGGFIRILEISGSSNGFTQFLTNVVKSRRQSLLATVAVGIVIFIDDYLNCLAVSNSVKKLTDYYKVSREKLAYIIDSTAAPTCVIVPVSTWAVYFAGLLEEAGAVEKGQGIAMYIKSIPYMVYAWIALIIVALVAADVIGDFGPMKAAEARAKAGKPIPDGFHASDLVEDNRALIQISYRRRLWNFIFPMILLVAATVYFEIDLLRGVILTCAVTIAWFWLQGLLTFEEQVESLFHGFKIMMYPLAAVIAGYFLKGVNDELGMTKFVIEAAMPYVSAQTFPIIIFIAMGIVVFSTGSSWGVFVITIPIVVPIAQQLGTPMPLVVGALLSASSFGSHACFFSDSSLLASQGSGCTPMQHAFTQLPYALLGAALAAVTLLILGYTLS
ncbi:Na+/H+ antiporter NhaC family protein [Dichelobacter nodosus]|uniref:Na+/H+ antiporter NhaC family protein n=1 Tax=Dichelobacter nodosus TaxID=870 RepID=UPI0006803A1D|nr:Na+/H+ antiporter NhaC family protein [Dichelobacter nodosus]KNZ39880.1 sodium:proton antiporter [Dichelobacter nodosus]